jgi:prepilin-type N-terminal cleavage/methylation domain-containing protein
MAAPNNKVKALATSGFTLIEVILTLVMLGYIVSCIYPCLIYTIDAKDRVESMSAVNKVGQAIIRQITHDLEGCYTPLGLQNPFEGIDNGTADSINFVTTVESAPDENGVRSNITEVGYRVEVNEQDPDYYVLLRREGFFVKDDPLKGGTLSEVYDRVRSFNLTYYDGENGWVDSWNCEEQEGPPLAVKIEFVVKVERETLGSEKEEEETELQKQEGYFSAIVTLPAQYSNFVSTPPPPAP